MPASSAGYSGTPLGRKLGLAPGARVWVPAPPEDYAGLVEVDGLVRLDAPGPEVDLAHLFLTERADLAAVLPTLRSTLRPDAVVWVSWPKKASRVPTTLTEDEVRALALPLGFVDVKVCAVTEVWSGLKLVVRRELR